MARQLILDVHAKLIVDLFAGGGGMSTAFEMAFGRSPDIAINHDEEAIAMHRANHPQTRHFIADVYEVCPIFATGGRPVGWLHLSPDCTDHSQAAGGQPRSKAIRGLSWVGYRWAAQTHPDCISLENVSQIQRWGPLIAKRDPATGRCLKRAVDDAGKAVWAVAEKGERVPVQDQFLIPDPKRMGQTWKKFIHALESLGYEVDVKVIRSCDLGAHTTRERLYMLARCDGLPIVWPEQTHFKNPENKKLRYKPAADCIDFNIATPSIFTRKKELAQATQRRLAKGIKKFVLDNASPFIVPIAHYNGSVSVHSIQEPLRTVVSSTKGGEFALATPMIVPATHQGGDRVYNIQDPMRTVTAAHRGEFMLSSPVLAKFRGASPGHSLNDPAPVITAGGNCARPAGAAHALGLVSPILVQAAHGEGAPGKAQRWGVGSRSVADPIGTVTASGGHAVAEASLRPIGEDAASAAQFLIQTGYGERKGQAPRVLDIEAPLGTVVGTGKHAVGSAILVGAGGPEYAGKPASVEDPLGTSLTENHRCVATAYMMQANGGFNQTPGHELRTPVSAVTSTGSQQQLVTAHLATLRNNCVGVGAEESIPTVAAKGGHHCLVSATLITNTTGHDATDLTGPAPTIATGGHHAVASAFLSRQFGASIGHGADEPHGTITAGGGGKSALVECVLSQEDREAALRVARWLQQFLDDTPPAATEEELLALVTVMVDGVPHVIVDIGLRMLQPRELFRAQDFPENYIIEYGIAEDGRRIPLSKSAQTRMCGNSVNPVPAAAFLRCNAPQLAVRRVA